MKRFWRVLAVAFVAIFAATGCNDYGNTFQVPTGASISSLSPRDIAAGSPQFTLTINGSGFVAKTVVQWNGKNLPTNVQVDAAGNILGVSATVSAALVAKPGTVFVNTFSPHSGAGTNGLSNPLPFVIDPPGNPLPIVTSMSPSCAVAGGAGFTLTITGSNFLPATDPSGGSQVHWSAATQDTLPIVGTATSSQIQATVSATLIASVGTAGITVFNPPSPQSSGGNGGGGTSATTLTFTVQTAACPAGSAIASAQNVSAVEETPAVSADGRYVAYTAIQDEHTQVLLRDTCEDATGACQPRTTLLSATLDGTAGNDDSRSPSISADGRYVAFSSAASNLLSDAPAGRQVYLRDTCAGAGPSCVPSTRIVSTDSNGALVGTESILPSISASGRFVAFMAVTPSHTKSSTRAKSNAGALNSGFRQVFVRDTCLGVANCAARTTRISLQPGEAPASGAKPAGPALSGQAKHIALPGANASTLFTRGKVIDDQVFLALTTAGSR